MTVLTTIFTDPISVGGAPSGVAIARPGRALVTTGAV